MMAPWIAPIALWLLITAPPGGANEAAPCGQGPGGYVSRELVRSGGLVLRWRHPGDEVFVYLLPTRLEAAGARAAAMLGLEVPPPREVVLAADRDDLAAFAGVPVEQVRARDATGAICGDTLVLLSPSVEPEGPAWTEALAEQLTRRALAKAYGAATPAWLIDGAAQVADGRFEGPGRRRWSLPPQEEARRALAASSSGALNLPDPQAGLVGALVVRAVLRVQGRQALRDLLASGASSLPRARLQALLADEWSREARRTAATPPAGGQAPRTEPVERALRLARLLLAGDHPHAALAELRKAHALEGSVATGLAMLPLAVQLGDWDTAAELCTGLPPTEADGYAFRFFCGQLYAARQEYAAAAEAFERAVEHRPYDVPTHRALLGVREHRQEARAKLDQALILDVIGAREEGP